MIRYKQAQVNNKDFTAVIKVKKDPKPEEVKKKNIALKNSVVRSRWILGLIVTQSDNFENLPKLIFRQNGLTFKVIRSMLIIFLIVNAIVVLISIIIMSNLIDVSIQKFFKFFVAVFSHVPFGLDVIYKTMALIQSVRLSKQPQQPNKEDSKSSNKKMDKENKLDKAKQSFASPSVSIFYPHTLVDLGAIKSLAFSKLPEFSQNKHMVKSISTDVCYYKLSYGKYYDNVLREPALDFATPKTNFADYSDLRHVGSKSNEGSNITPFSSGENYNLPQSNNVSDQVYQSREVLTINSPVDQTRPLSRFVNTNKLEVEEKYDAKFKSKELERYQEIYEPATKTLFERAQSNVIAENDSVNSESENDASKNSPMNSRRQAGHRFTGIRFIEKIYKTLSENQMKTTRTAQNQTFTNRRRVSAFATKLQEKHFRFPFAKSEINFDLINKIQNTFFITNLSLLVNTGTNEYASSSYLDSAILEYARSFGLKIKRVKQKTDGESGSLIMIESDNLCSTLTVLAYDEVENELRMFVRDEQTSTVYAYVRCSKKKLHTKYIKLLKNKHNLPQITVTNEERFLKTYFYLCHELVGQEVTYLFKQIDNLKGKKLSLRDFFNKTTSYIFQEKTLEFILAIGLKEKLNVHTNFLESMKKTGAQLAYLTSDNFLGAMNLANKLKIIDKKFSGYRIIFNFTDITSGQIAIKDALKALEAVFLSQANQTENSSADSNFSKMAEDHSIDIEIKTSRKVPEVNTLFEANKDDKNDEVIVLNVPVDKAQSQNSDETVPHGNSDVDDTLSRDKYENNQNNDWSITLSPLKYLSSNSQFQLPDNKNDSNIVLIVSGKALENIFVSPYLYFHFKLLLGFTKTFMGIRLTPHQKAQIVQLLRDMRSDGAVLAIGNCEKDQDMLNAADVGVQLVSGNTQQLLGHIAVSNLGSVSDLVFNHGRLLLTNQLKFACFSLAVSFIWVCEALLHELFFSPTQEPFPNVFGILSLQTIFWSLGIFMVIANQSSIERKFWNYKIVYAEFHNTLRKLYSYAFFGAAKGFFFGAVIYLGIYFLFEALDTDLSIKILFVFLLNIFVVLSQIFFLSDNKSLWLWAVLFGLLITGVGILSVLVSTKWFVVKLLHFSQLTEKPIIWAVFAALFVLLFAIMFGLFYAVENRYLQPIMKALVNCKENEVDKILDNSKQDMDDARNSGGLVSRIYQICPIFELFDPALTNMLNPSSIFSRPIKLERLSLKIENKNLNENYIHYHITKKHSPILYLGSFSTICGLVCIIGIFLTDQNFIRENFKIITTLVLFLLLVPPLKFVLPNKISDNTYRYLALFLWTMLYIIYFNSIKYMIIFSVLSVMMVAAIDNVSFVYHFVSLIFILISVIAALTIESFVIYQSPYSMIINVMLTIHVLLQMVIFTAIIGFNKFYIEKKRRKSFIVRARLQHKSNYNNELLTLLMPKFVLSRISFELSETCLAEDIGLVTVIFIEICDFDIILAQHKEDIILFLDQLFKIFDEECEKFGVQKIETVGKTYMAAAGITFIEEKLPKNQRSIIATKRVLDLGLSLMRIVERYSQPREHPIRLKIGIHEGKCMMGVLGYHKPQFSLIGDTINTTSRLCTTGVDGHIMISENSFTTLRNFIIDDQQMIKKYMTYMKGKGEVPVYHLFIKQNMMKKRLLAAISRFYRSSNNQQPINEKIFLYNNLDSQSINKQSNLSSESDCSVSQTNIDLQNKSNTLNTSKENFSENVDKQSKINHDYMSDKEEASQHEIKSSRMDKLTREELLSLFKLVQFDKNMSSSIIFRYTHMIEKVLEINKHRNMPMKLMNDSGSMRQSALHRESIYMAKRNSVLNPHIVGPQFSNNNFSSDSLDSKRFDDIEELSEYQVNL